VVKYYWNVLFLVCIVFIVFSPALYQPFVHWDDDVHCYDNPNVRGLDGGHIEAIFSTDVNKTYIPLTIFSFALEYHFFKTNPFFYHFDNVLLHAGVVLLVFLLASRLGLSQGAAFLGALLFGIHPMHVESVAWVTQRKDVLYSLFYLLCCWHYVGYLKSRRMLNYIWALLFAFVSILAKPMALSLPLILCLLDWFVKGGRPARASWFDKVPFGLVVFPIAWVTYLMNMRAIDLNWTQAPLVWLWSFSFYLLKFVFPKELLALYQLPAPVNLFNPQFFIAVVIFVIFFLSLILFRRQRLFVFACLYFFLSIFFLLRFDNKQDLSFVADRFMYLPSLGFCWLFGFYADSALFLLKERPIFRRLLLGAVCLLYALLGNLAYHQTKLWGDEFLIWSRVAERFPSAAAYNHLGNYFLNQRDYAQALSYYDKVIAIDPRYHKPYGNRGVVHLQERNYDAAIADFTIVIALNPADAAGAFNNRGYAYLQLHDLDAALMDFHRAIVRDPQNFRAYMNRATVYKNIGQFNLAMQDLLAALRINPDDRAVKSNIQWLNKRMGR
jgi:tetratricopeptide (TPR) repeat protein